MAAPLQVGKNNPALPLGALSSPLVAHFLPLVLGSTSVQPLAPIFIILFHLT